MLKRLCTCALKSLIFGERGDLKFESKPKLKVKKTVNLTEKVIKLKLKFMLILCEDLHCSSLVLAQIKQRTSSTTRTNYIYFKAGQVVVLTEKPGLKVNQSIIFLVQKCSSLLVFCAGSLKIFKLKTEGQTT